MCVIFPFPFLTYVVLNMKIKHKAHCINVPYKHDVYAIMMVIHTEKCVNDLCCCCCLSCLCCSVQSGGQRHFLVHHLERLCKCDHTWEGKSIFWSQKQYWEMSGVSLRIYECNTQSTVLHLGPGNDIAWGWGLWAAGFAERRTSCCHHHPERRQLPFPSCWQAGLHTHPQGVSEKPIAKCAASLCI